MKRMLLAGLPLLIAASVLAAPARHAAASCDPFDTRLCTDETYDAGGVAKVSFEYSRYMLGQVGVAGPLGGPAGFGGGYGQAAPAEGPQ